MTDPFRKLEPPSGGWAATRERIVAHERRRFQRIAALALAAMLALVFVIMARPEQDASRARPAIDHGVHPDLAMLDPVDEPVRLAPSARGHAGLLRVETPESPDVIFYHVLTTPAPATPRPEE